MGVRRLRHGDESDADLENDQERNEEIQYQPEKRDCDDESATAKSQPEKQVADPAGRRQRADVSGARCRCHDAAPQLSNATGLLACQVTETRSSQSITASEARTWFGIVTLICLPLSSSTR